MAYKTAEERHEKQNTHTGSFSLENRLMQYLRENYTVETADNALGPLKQIAADYDKKIGVQRTPDLYDKICLKAIEQFKSNWEGKTEGQDKGNRLGETYDSWKTTANVLQGML